MTTDAGSINPADVVDDVLITPRVVDQGAFAQYADVLRGLIETSSARAAELASLGAEAEQRRQQSEQAAKDLRKQIETGVRLIPTIDQRADTVRALVERIDNAEASGEQRLAELEKRIETELEPRIAEKLASVEQRLDESIRLRAQQLAAQEARAADLESRAAAAEARIDDAERLFGELTRNMAERIGELGRTIRSNEHALTLAAEGAETAADDALAGLARAREESESIGQELADRLGEIAAAGDRLESLTTDARALAEGSDDEPGLTRLIERGETAKTVAQEALQTAEAFREQMEIERAQLAESILSGADQIDALEARRAELERSIDDTAKLIEARHPEAIDRLNELIGKLRTVEMRRSELAESFVELRRAADDCEPLIEQRAKEMQSIVDGSMVTMTERVEQAGAWLGKLVQRAEAAGQRLTEVKP